VFAVLFTGAFVAFAEISGTFADPNSTFIEYYASSGNRARDIAGMYLMTGAAVAFTVFAIGLAQRLQGPEVSLAPAIISATALLFAACLLVAAALLGTVSMSRTMADLFDDTDVLAGGEMAVLPQAGNVVIMIPGAVMAAATVVVISLRSWASRALPRWICIFGFVASVLLVLLAFSGPHLLLLPAWVLAASIAIARSEPQEA
jgi:hypothetical protein